METFKIWLFESEDLKLKIDSLLDSEGFILFFKKGDDYFAAPEDSRVMFAKIKNPDDDLPNGWEEEASFSADNLTKKIKGEPATSLFKKSDLKEIKIMNRDEMFKCLQKVAKSLGDEAFKKKDHGFKMIDIASLFSREPDTAPNFVRADED